MVQSATRALTYVCTLSGTKRTVQTEMISDVFF